MPDFGGGYVNPFYHPASGVVSGELSRRAQYHGAKVRGVGKPFPINVVWSYAKVPWGRVSGKGASLGLPGTKIMSNAKGDLTLYSAARNVPKKPLLQSIDISNEGTLGSLLKGKFSFVCYPSLSAGGFSVGGVETAFFNPGAEVSVAWGWSAGSTAANRQGFKGIVYDFNWSFNSDLSLSADCSIVSAATIALGASGDQSTEPDGEAPPVTDPTEVPIKGTNLASVFDADIAAATSGGSGATGGGGESGGSGGGKKLDWQATKAGELKYFPKDNTVSKLFDYVAIGLPFQETSPTEDEAGGSGGSGGGGASGGSGAPVQTFWYTSVERLVEYGNTVIQKYEKNSGTTALSAAYKMQVDGNQTAYNADVKSAYPVDVIFPDETMGVYGDLAPEYSQIAGKKLNEDGVNISRILLGTNYLKETYKQFTDEQTANIPFKNITKFFETMTKRINYATGDIYQITAVLCENPNSFDASVGGKIDKAILSIEDSNLSKKYTDNVKPVRFDASIFRPLIRNVSITCKPPSAMATAAYVQQRGKGVANVEVQAGAPAGGKAEEALKDMTTATENFSATGFNNAWCEAFRGNLQKYKKSGGAGGEKAHWLNQALYPINLSITIDGISGWRFGDVIDTSLVPSRYVGKVAFVVTKIDHKITSAAWETTLNTACRIKPDADI